MAYSKGISYINPIWWPQILIEAGIFIFLFVVALHAWIVEDDIAFAIWTLFSLAIFAPIIAYVWIIKRPKAVELSGDGVLLKFRITKSIFVPFEDVLVIYPYGAKVYDSGMKIRGKSLAYHLSPVLCKEIDSAYQRKMGMLAPKS